MSDFSSNAPDQSYWDWLKQQLGVPQAQGSAVTPAQASLLSQADQLGQGIQPASPIDATPMSDYRGAGIQAPVSQIDATPMSDYRGAGIQTTMPVMPSPTPNISTVATPAPVDPTANYINRDVFGFGPKVDPNEVNPATGLTNAQTQMMQYNMLGSVGAKLLAAGQNIMPAQRAQILGEIGNAASEPMTAMTQMQQRLLQNNKLARENSQQANLAKIMQSDKFDEAVKAMPKQYQPIAEAYRQAGDLPGFNKLQEFFTPKPDMYGNYTIPGYNIVGNVQEPGMEKQLTPTGAIPTNAAQIANNANSNPFNPTAYGLPENYTLPAGSNFTALPESLKQEFSKVRAGEATMQQITKGRNYDLKVRQMQQAFPDWSPAVGVAQYNRYQNLQNGKLSFIKSQAGTTFGHEYDAIDALYNLKNGTLPAFNTVKNAYEDETGSSEQKAAAAAFNTYGAEMASLIKGGKATDSEIQDQRKALSIAASPAQMTAVMKVKDAQMRDRILSENANSQDLYGPAYNPKKHSVVNSRTADLLTRIDNHPLMTGKQGAGNVSSPAGQNTPLKPGNYKYNPQTEKMDPM